MARSLPLLNPPRGTWLIASMCLGRPVPVSDRYPHICGSIVIAPESGREVKLWGRDCARCAGEKAAEVGRG